MSLHTRSFNCLFSVMSRRNTRRVFLHLVPGFHSGGSESKLHIKPLFFTFHIELKIKIHCHKSRLIVKGYKSELSKEDMWDLDQSEKSKLLSDELEEAWNNAVK